MRIDRRALHELLFGSLHRCCLCQKEEVLGPEGLCSACRKSLRLCPAPASPFPLDGLTAGLLYEGEVPGAISRFKNREQLYLGGFFPSICAFPLTGGEKCWCPCPCTP